MDDGLAVILVAGGALLIGLIAGYFLARISRESSDRANATRELAQYREQVAEHFASTAKLVNRMTDSYREVFEQLQSGAEQLIGEERLRELLADESGQTITLKRIGYQEEKAGAAPASAAKADRTAGGGTDRKPAQGQGGAAKTAPKTGKEADTARLKAVTDDKASASSAAGTTPGTSGKTPGAGPTGQAKEADAKPAPGRKTGGGDATPKAGATGTKAPAAGGDAGGKGDGKSGGKPATAKPGDDAKAKPSADAARAEKAGTVATAKLDEKDLAQVPRKTNGNGGAAPQPKR